MTTERNSFMEFANIQKEESIDKNKRHSVSNINYIQKYPDTKTVFNDVRVQYQPQKPELPGRGSIVQFCG